MLSQSSYYRLLRGDVSLIFFNIARRAHVGPLPLFGSTSKLLRTRVIVGARDGWHVPAAGLSSPAVRHYVDSSKVWLTDVVHPAMDLQIHVQVDVRLEWCRKRCGDLGAGVSRIEDRPPLRDP